VGLVTEKDKFSQCKLWQYKETRGDQDRETRRTGHGERQIFTMQIMAI